MGQLPLRIRPQLNPAAAGGESSRTPRLAAGGSWLYSSMNNVSYLGLASRSVAKNKVPVEL